MPLQWDFPIQTQNQKVCLWIKFLFRCDEDNNLINNTKIEKVALQLGFVHAPLLVYNKYLGVITS